MRPDIQQKVLLVASLLLFLFLSQYDVTYSYWLKNNNTGLLAKKRRKKNQLLWSAGNERISGTQFHWMFWMRCDSFESICQCIISLVGKKKLKKKTNTVCIMQMLKLLVGTYLESNELLLSAHLLLEMHMI